MSLAAASPLPAAAAEVLSVRDLTVTYRGAASPALRSASLTVGRGEIVALVGESGSGKSTFISAVLGALPDGARVAGQVELAPAANDSTPEIGYVPQDPLTNFNPVMRVFHQALEVARVNRRASRADAAQSVRTAFSRVRLGEGDGVAHKFPHELSGGMRQRALIAIALLNDPQLLLADEPTASLDVSVQREILNLLAGLVREDDRGMLLVTHDLALATEYADRVVVLRAGEVVESGPSDRVFGSPQHGYTRELAVAAARFLVSDRDPGLVPQLADAPVLLEGRALSKHFRARGQRTTVLSDVDFSIRQGRTLGLVGASGSGKSTLASLALGIAEPSSGSLVYHGQELGSLSRRGRRAAFRRIQPVFQDPHASLDPTFTVRRALAEGQRAGARSHEEEQTGLTALLDRVGLPSAVLDRLPHELSGGQKQRVAIARSLAARPEILVCDEAVSALDVVVQAQILELLETLQRDQGLSILFISHDLGVVQQLAHDVVVLDDGAVAESGPVEDVLYAPRSDAARALLAAVPRPRELAAA